MDGINITQLIGNFVIASVFVWAWFQERKERQTLQERWEKRSDEMITKIIELLQTMIYMPGKVEKSADGKVPTPN